MWRYTGKEEEVCGMCGGINLYGAWHDSRETVAWRVKYLKKGEQEKQELNSKCEVSLIVKFLVVNQIVLVQWSYLFLTSSDLVCRQIYSYDIQG